MISDPPPPMESSASIAARYSKGCRNSEERERHRPLQPVQASFSDFFPTPVVIQNTDIMIPQALLNTEPKFIRPFRLSIRLQITTRIPSLGCNFRRPGWSHDASQAEAQVEQGDDTP